MVVKNLLFLIFMLPILGVLIIDVKFDLHHDSDLTKWYYVGQNNTKPPGQFFGDILIGLSFITLFYNVVSRKSIWDFLTLISMTASLLFGLYV